MFLTGWPIRSENFDWDIGLIYFWEFFPPMPSGWGKRSLKSILPKILLNIYCQMSSWNNLVAKILWSKSDRNIQNSNQSQQNLFSNQTGHPVLARPFRSFLFLLLHLARVTRRLFSGRAETEKKGHLSPKHIALIDLTSYFPQAHLHCRFHLAFSFIVLTLQNCCTGWRLWSWKSFCQHAINSGYQVGRRAAIATAQQPAEYFIKILFNDIRMWHLVRVSS